MISRRSALKTFLAGMAGLFGLGWASGGKASAPANTAAETFAPPWERCEGWEFVTQVGDDGRTDLTITGTFRQPQDAMQLIRQVTRGIPPWPGYARLSMQAVPHLGGLVSVVLHDREFQYAKLAG